jgi:hypothetical protein
MLETDQAEFFDDLTEFYFSYSASIATPAQLSFQSSKSSNGNRVRRGRLAKNAQIMPKEPKPRLAANAKPQLGKLSAATRRCRDLEEQLGESEKHATITKVEKATGRKGEFKFAPLRRWCRDKGIEAKNVPDERYGSVKSWPRCMAGCLWDRTQITLREKNNAES